MKKLMLIAIAATVAIAGCKSIEFEKTERQPNADGTIVERTVHGSYYAYGIENNLEGLEINATPTSGVSVAINRVSYDMSAKHKEIVTASLDGAATLASKIGAAIATAGGSAGADALLGYVKQFVAKGGDPAKATVTVTDGKVTCTDGSCSITCADGSCEL